MVHTGHEFIPANTPVFWEAPDRTDNPEVIKGMPNDAVYPLIKAYKAETLTGIIADALINTRDSGSDSLDALGVGPDARVTKAALKSILRKKLSVWSRVIGWTLNE